MARTEYGTGRGEEHTRREDRRPDGKAEANAAAKVAALRREVPCTVAILVGEEDFTAMRVHVTARFDDYEDYLRHTDDLLRALHARGMQVSVTVFDPVEFAAFCSAEGLDPGARSTRARYTAAVAAPARAVPGTGADLPGPGGFRGPAAVGDSRSGSSHPGPAQYRGVVEYRGERLDTVVRTLLHGAGRRTAGVYADAVLAGSEHGRRARAAMARTLADLVERAGPGTHQIVCSATVHGTPLLAVLRADGAPGGRGLDQEAAALLCSVLAAGVITDGAGGVVLRTRTEDDRNDMVRGWALREGRLHPLSEAEVFNAYCTDHRTGDPVAPEPGVDYTAGYGLPENGWDG